jgi:hypothetical protein
MLRTPNHIKAIAARPTTAAAMANPVSSVLIVLEAGAAWRGAAAGAAAGRAGGAPTLEGRAEGGATATAGAALGRGAGPGAIGACELGGGAAGLAGAPAGKEGSLMVALGLGAATPGEEGGGPAAGFGGKLIRTVSFFGWTFALSAGLGGTPGPGGVGLFSAIFNKTLRCSRYLSNPYCGSAGCRVPSSTRLAAAECARPWAQQLAYVQRGGKVQYPRVFSHCCAWRTLAKAYAASATIQRTS